MATKKINLNAIQNELLQEKENINNGTSDVYNFLGYLSKKYFSEVDPNWADRLSSEEDPYNDILFCLCDIHGVNLY